jgi:hypothetical protein
MVVQYRSVAVTVHCDVRHNEKPVLSTAPGVYALQHPQNQ